MKELSKIKSVKELRAIRLQAKNQIELERLEFENAKLKLRYEMNLDRFLPDLSNLVVGSLQKSIFGSVIKLFKK